MQIDYQIHAGIAVSEEGTVFVISGGAPGGPGKNPSPMVTEVLCFPDVCPADRRADFVDLRGNSFPNPPALNVVHVYAGGEGRVVKKSDLPELACRTQIIVQPPKHRPVPADRTFQRLESIDGNKMRVGPIEGIVTASVGWWYPVGGNGVDR